MRQHNHISHLGDGGIIYGPFRMLLLSVRRWVTVIFNQKLSLVETTPSSLE